MDAFRFSPELFEVRTDVLQQLSDEGFDWLSHYSSIDPDHETYGIEVGGIHDREDAVLILRLLVQMFPTWMPARLQYKDYGGEPGWKAKVYRDRPRERERWETA